MRDYRIESPIGPRVIIDGREVDYFSGTGYLGLQSNPQVIRAAVDAVTKYGLSTATSRGGFGEHPVYDELEKEACTFFNAEKALVFPSGYMGMGILLQTNTHSGDHIFIDSMAHYSLWDAAQASTRLITPFHHRSAESLLEKIKIELQPCEHPLVISDGVFPISGEIAPLPELLEVIRPYGGRVFLDDAHAMGVLGNHGRGCLDHFQIDGPEVLTCGTLAKALGGYGGVITGPAEWIDRVEQNSGVCIGASPIPLVTAAASTAALRIARENPDLRERLWGNVTLARNGLRSLGWKMDDTPVPILCLPALPGLNLSSLEKRLFEKGIAVAYVREYTSTPPGGALRVAISAGHTTQQITRFIEVLGRLM